MRVTALIRVYVVADNEADAGDVISDELQELSWEYVEPPAQELSDAG